MMVDLRSDTVTRPTPAMRRAIAEAEVGDDVLGDDPTVQRLEAMAAERLGKQAAMYVPSGTMANQIAIHLHTRPGDAVLMEAGAHPFNYEAGAPAMLSGVTVRPIPGERGVLDPDDIEAAFPPDDPHFSPVSLITAEDTANRGGGTVYPLAVLDRLASIAHAHGARAHLDGARLFNAAVASGIPAARRAQGYDTVSVCLSKGLGAPVGSLLCGESALIHRARRVRKALGGAMRQSGLLAAAGIHALTHHVERLADDHARAMRLAEGLRTAGYPVLLPPSNMVFIEVADPQALVERVAAMGVLCLPAGPHTIRLVTHLDVHDDDITQAISAFSAQSQLGIPE